MQFELWSCMECKAPTTYEWQSKESLISHLRWKHNMDVGTDETKFFSTLCDWHDDKARGYYDRTFMLVFTKGDTRVIGSFALKGIE